MRTYSVILAAALLATPGTRAPGAPAPAPAATLSNDLVRLEIDADATTRALIDPRTGINHALRAPFAAIQIGARQHPATRVAMADGRLRFAFGETGASAVVSARATPGALIFEVDSVEGAGADRLLLPDIRLSLKGEPGEPFAACALALNVRTNVTRIPGPSPALQAIAYRHLGFRGALVALVACPADQLRRRMGEVVDAAPDLPHSAIGGPRALDGPENRGSYLFNFADLTEETADRWIALCRQLGLNQIDFHGGRSFRFGDCEPDPKLYPRGRASLKAVIDRLHAAGISAGLHTYSQFLSPRSSYVSPVPHPDLGKESSFTLAAALDQKATFVPVTEPLDGQGATSGFLVRGSLTLQIDDELITFRAVENGARRGFDACTRGAHGTRAAPHPAGARAHRLRGCFNLLLPGGDTPLYAEVAARTAEMFNECGFDMIYLDALDGSDAVEGREWSWYHGSKFVFEIWKRLRRPALMEMSTFHHHLWYVRSRMGAWDHPNRGHKRFIDLHVASNANWARSFLPAHLGWWSFKTWRDWQGEPTYADDIEYLCARCIGTDSGLSIMGIDPRTAGEIPALPRLAAIVRDYETLRHSGTIGEAIKRELRVPGAEFTLDRRPDGTPRLVRARHERHTVTCADGPRETWRVENGFGPQPVALRIQTLLSAAAPEAPDAVDLLPPAAATPLPERAAARGISATLEPCDPPPSRPGRALRLRATNTGAPRESAWARFGARFDPPRDLSKTPALGVWIHGDGSGLPLNFQILNPPHLSRALGDRVATLDFRGWRYVELVELEGASHATRRWPESAQYYAAYRETIQPKAIERFHLACGAIPAGGAIDCRVGPIRALPVVSHPLRNPRVAIGSKAIRFNVEMPPGAYLEFQPPRACKLYGPRGESLGDVAPEGEPPALVPGPNEIEFACDPGRDGTRPRAHVWIITRGEALDPAS